MLQISKSITVRRPRGEVYRFWRDLNNWPRFMQQTADVEIVGEEGSELIRWRSARSSDLRCEGIVRLRDAPGDRGTEIEVQLQYDAAGGPAAGVIAKLFGADPKQQMRDDLRRFKQVIETGEVVLSDGSLEGAGEGAMKERAAQPPELEKST